MASFIHIVAMSKNGCIGIDDKLPFDIPEDLLNFQALTADNLICMGFNTFKSIEQNYTKKGKPFLPGRQVTVICSTADKAVQRSEEYKQYDNVLFLVTNVFNQLVSRNNKPIIIVGGARLYKQYRPNLIIAAHVDMDVPLPAPVSPVVPVAPTATTSPAASQAPGTAPVAPPVVPVPAKPSPVLYPYFDELQTRYFGLSFVEKESKTGQKYNYTIHYGNF